MPGTALLQTDRLRLRAFQDGDLDALGALYADPEVTRYLCPPLDRLAAFRAAAAAIAFCQRRADPNQPGIWAIEARADGRLIGRVGLSPWDDGERLHWELGYLLATGQRGQGLATEAATALRDHAKTVLGLPTLVALVHPENEGSKRVLTKMRFWPHPGWVVQQAGMLREVWTWP